MNIIKDILKNNFVIGKGTFGKIYFSDTYPQYIVKRVRKYYINSFNFISNNLKELWWYSLISSCDKLKNIPKLKDYHIDSDYIYFLLEYNGNSIFNLINQISYYYKLENVSYLTSKLTDDEILSDDNNILSDDNNILSDDNNILSDDNNILSDDNNILSDENNILSEWTAELLTENKILSDENKILLEEKKILLTDNKNLLEKTLEFRTEKENINTNLENNIILKSKELHIKLIKLIPNILYSCTKILLQLHYSFMRHGDITTSNILIDDNENITLIDWGSVVFNKTSMGYYNHCAKPFTPPEMKNSISELNENICDYCNTINNINIPSIKNDVFSLGIVILHILDPLNKYIPDYEKYINTNIYEYNYFNFNTFFNLIINEYSYIKEIWNTNELNDIFYIIIRMLDLNIENRIDIESLYISEIFKNIKDENINNYYLKNIMRTNIDIKELNERDKKLIFDTHKELLIKYCFLFLDKYKLEIKNIIDTRIILLPSIYLFYFYKYKLLKENEEQIQIFNNNINHYIITFLCCIKWIDIIFNDDISLISLYNFYILLYNKLKSKFNNSSIISLTEFNISFDINFFLIFNKVKYIFRLPNIMDYKIDNIDYIEIRNSLLNCKFFDIIFLIPHI